MKAVAVNSSGRRIGDSHHNAKLKTHEVDLIRELHEEHGLGYRRLSEKFEVSRSTIRDVCLYRIHCQTPDRWKWVRVAERFVLRCRGGQWCFSRAEV